MSLRGRAAIVGVAESRLGKVPDATVIDLQAEAAAAALADAGLGIGDVDGLLSAGHWGRNHQLQLGEALGISPSYSDGTVVGGASFEFHLGHAAAAIAAGLCRVALICYGSTQRSQRERSARPPAQQLGFQYEAPFGLPTPVGAYALAASAHMHRFGTTAEQLAEVAVAARQWASLNPVAYRREPLSVADVLASEPIADPLRRLDCCLVTDGGGAVVVAHPDVVRQTSKAPVWLLGHGEAHTHSQIAQMPDLLVTPAAQAGARAFAMAGVTHDDLDVVQIYDSFTITVLLTLESLGFAPPGGATRLIAERGIGPDGAFPLNTSGGGLSYTHPGMFGIFLIIEAVRQLRGEAGERQVPGAELGLISGTGGTLSSNATCILGLER